MSEIESEILGPLPLKFEHSDQILDDLSTGLRITLDRNEISSVGNCVKKATGTLLGGDVILLTLAH